MPKLTHPGEILRKEYLQPLKLKGADLARATGLSTGRVSEILSGKRELTIDQIRQIHHAWGIPVASLIGELEDA